MEEKLRPHLPTELKEDRSSKGQYPWEQGWRWAYITDYELVKTTPKKEIFNVTQHWFTHRGDEIVYCYSVTNIETGNRFLALGGPLDGQTVSRMGVNRGDYHAFNNAGALSAHTMIWVHKSLLNR